MVMDNKKLTSEELLKSVIQRIATGPEMSKDISRQEAKDSMTAIFNKEISDIRTAIFLIALRMKRETEEENLGVQDAFIDTVKTINIKTDNLVNIADPYDGYTRNIPSSVFILPVLAELGIPAISQGVETVGPKYGCTHHLILKLHGLDVLANHEQVKERVENKEIGWGYIDQKIFSPKLYELMNLRGEIIKRPIITTIEVLANPLIARKNHFITGYVHKAYPPIYLALARNAEFDTALLVKGTEGGVVPSLRHKTNVHYYKKTNDNNDLLEIDPEIDLGIKQDLRAVQIPNDVIRTKKSDKVEADVDPLDIAKDSLKKGFDALSGSEGIMKDCVLYSTSIIMHHVTGEDLNKCKNEIDRVMKSGAALKRFKMIK